MVIRVETGIAGFDKMLRGGFPHGRMILVIGGPGTGKTIFGSQFLYHGATELGEKSVYISLDETRPHFLEEMLTFGWDFKELERDKRFTFIDASNIRRIPEETKIGVSRVAGKEAARERLKESIFTMYDGTKARAIDRFIGDLGAQRVVLDSISGLTFRFPEAWEKRQAILEIYEALASVGATCLVTSEAISVGEERQVQPEEYLSHGVVLLQTLGTGERAVRIVKMRGTEVDSTPRPYQIGQTGIEVYPEQSIFET